jgi:hypothetical protein
MNPVVARVSSGVNGSGGGAATSTETNMSVERVIPLWPEISQRTYKFLSKRQRCAAMIFILSGGSHSDAFDINLRQRGD